MRSGPSSKVTANVRTKNINQSHPEVKVIKTYTPSDYRGMYVKWWLIEILQKIKNLEYFKNHS